MATLKYFAQKSEDGYPIPSTMMGFKQDPPAGNLVEIPAEDSAAAEGQSVKTPNSGLRYFVRRDAHGKIIPNSLITSLKKPKGLVYEFKVIQGTATPAPTGIAVKVGRSQMGDTPVCEMTQTNLTVQITAGGTTMSDATFIAGDFRSLGAYFTPKDLNDGMAQDPRFRVAYFDEESGKWKSRQFKLTAVGVASGEDAMFGTTQESNCQSYWLADHYNIQLGCSATTQTDVVVIDASGTLPPVGKYFHPVGNTTDTYVIKSRTTPQMSTITLEEGYYDTCAQSFV